MAEVDGPKRTAENAVDRFLDQGSLDALTVTFLRSQVDQLPDPPDTPLFTGPIGAHRLRVPRLPRRPRHGAHSGRAGRQAQGCPHALRHAAASTWPHATGEPSRGVRPVGLTAPADFDAPTAARSSCALADGRRVSLVNSGGRSGDLELLVRGVETASKTWARGAPAEIHPASPHTHAR